MRPEPTLPALRRCFREPCDELIVAAQSLDSAVSAHLAGQHRLAEELLRAADISAIREWTESIWGRNSPYVGVPLKVTASHSPNTRVAERMPSATEKRAIHLRDGFICRFCGLPVIRSETRRRIAAAYPKAVPWGRTNASQHAAFQAMWAQYDHVVPHAHGGDNSLENLVLTCAACNFGRMSYSLEEVSLEDPRLRSPSLNAWDGLERFRSSVTSEKALDKAFDQELRTSPAFASWLLGKTKFSSRGGVYVWSRADHPWCRMTVGEIGDPFGAREVESETDIVAVFSDADGKRFSLHIENKRSAGSFRPSQPELYAKRAAYWLNNPKFGDYSEFSTVLIAPKAFERKHPIESATFDCFVSHEDIASFIPLFETTRPAEGASNISLQRDRDG